MQIDIIGAPVDFGAGRRGVDMGPGAVRVAGLLDRVAQLGHDVRDVGNVVVPLREESTQSEPRMRFIDLILPVQMRIASAVRESYNRDRFPIVIGGDHSVALGAISAAARGRKIGVLWLDTHGDFNTAETTRSGNVHGMPLAALAGYGDERLVSVGGWRDAVAAVDPRNIVIVGARDLEPAERELLHEAGVTVLSMGVIDRYGIRRVVEKAIEIAGSDTEGIYASLDLDVMDPSHAPGVGTPSPGGLTVREAHLAMELLAASGRMIGLDLVEVNPILDERNRTAELAVDLCLSALGKRVWTTEEVPELEGR
jgi:arginase